MSFDPYRLDGAASAQRPAQSDLPTWGEPTPSSASLLQGAVASTSTFQSAGPPVLWPVLALCFGGSATVVAAAAAVVSGFGTSLSISALTWVSAGPIAIALLAVFTLIDTKRRANPFYTAASGARVLYFAALGVALLGVLLSSVHLAFWVGRL